MAKSVHNDCLDKALQWIEDNALEYYICSAEPTTYTEASSTYALADVTISSADFTGPADGDTSGRKTTVNQQNNVNIDASGTANHLALCGTASSPDLSGDTLMYVTQCASKAVTASTQETIAAWDIEIRDPQ